jgi:hypothetical protein
MEERALPGTMKITMLPTKEVCGWVLEYKGNALLGGWGIPRQCIDIKVYPHNSLASQQSRIILNSGIGR